MDTQIQSESLRNYALQLRPAIENYGFGCPVHFSILLESKSMKIAFVSQPIDTVLPPFQNSVGACTYGAALSLAKNHDVTVYGLRERQSLESEMSHRGVSFRFLRATSSDRLLYKLRTKASKFVRISSPVSTSGWLYPDYGRDVAHQLAEARPDVIHIQHCSQYVPVIRQLNPGAKVVLQLHAEWFSQCNPLALDRRLKALDLLTTVSDHITQKTRRDFPALAARCETIHNGISAAEFSGEKDYRSASSRRLKTIMYAGGVSPHKGLHVLLDAFEIVARRYPDVCLDIIGPHGTYPFEETFDVRDRALINQSAPFYSNGRLPVFQRSQSTNYLSLLQKRIPADIAGKVSFLGMIPRSELVWRYYNSDIFAFPPIWDEGFGIPPVEAMAAGVPVVATRSGAIVETVQHGRTGLLVDKNNPHSLAQALCQLLESESLREQLGRAARERAINHFTWDRTAEKIQQRYALLCAKHPALEVESCEDPQLSLARCQD